MGLGKTLTILSAIVASRADAAAFTAVHGQAGRETMHSPTRATLVVVTSRRRMPLYVNASRRLTLLQRYWTFGSLRCKSTLFLRRCAEEHI